MDYKKLYLQKKKEYIENKNIITGSGKASRKTAAKAAVRKAAPVETAAPVEANEADFRNFEFKIRNCG